MQKLALLFIGLAAIAAAGEVAVVTPSAIDNRQSTVADGSDAVTIPRMLSYQGKLTDTAAVPVADTTYSVAFRLYTVPSGGTQFWNETQTVRTKTGCSRSCSARSRPSGRCRTRARSISGWRSRAGQS